MSTPILAVVANPQQSGGAQRRLESITAISRYLGYRVEVVQPTVSLSPRRSRGALSVIPDLCRGGVVPEALAWDPNPVLDAVIGMCPRVVVYQTTRARHPALVRALDRSRATGRAAGEVVQVVDLVDRLGVSYRQRAKSGSALARCGFRALATGHSRTESRLVATSTANDGRLRVVVAGYREGRQLGVDWIPNVLPGDTVQNDARHHNKPEAGTGGDRPAIEPKPFDAVFFGTLSYRPNVEALRQLDSWIDESPHPAPSVMVAGRNPTAEVEELCRRRSWTLEPDYPSVSWLAERAAVAVAPLASTSGIQNKVMEAARAGMAQVVTSAAMAGYDPGLPLEPMDSGPAFVNEIRRLRHDRATAVTQVEAVRSHLASFYSVQAVAGRWARILDPKPDCDGGTEAKRKAAGASKRH